MGIVGQPTLCFQGLTGTLGVLREIRALPEGIRGLVIAVARLATKLEEAADLARQAGPLEARIEDLERTRAMWEATIEAELQKADSTYKSAANAENRARTMERHAEKLTDPFTEDGQPLEDGIPPEHVSEFGEEGLQPLPVALEAVSKKELAKRMKFMS